MTHKELLYLEDAIGHENNIISIINESINMATSKKIINFLNNELKVHNDLVNGLMKHMEGYINE